MVLHLRRFQFCPSAKKGGRGNGREWGKKKKKEHMENLNRTPVGTGLGINFLLIRGFEYTADYKIKENSKLRQRKLL